MSNDSKPEPKPSVEDDSEKKDALSEAELDEVAGGTLLNALNTAVKGIGDGLTSVARK